MREKVLEILSNNKCSECAESNKLWNMNTVCRKCKTDQILALFTPTPGELISDEEQKEINYAILKKHGFIDKDGKPDIPLEAMMNGNDIIGEQNKARLQAQARHSAQLKDREIRELFKEIDHELEQCGNDKGTFKVFYRSLKAKYLNNP